MDCYLTIFNGIHPKQCAPSKFARISLSYNSSKKRKRIGELPYEINICYPNDSEYTVTLLPDSITGIITDKCHLGECLLYISDYNSRLLITEAHPYLLKMMADNFKSLMEYRYNDIDIVKPLHYLEKLSYINNNFYQVINYIAYPRYITQVSCNVPLEKEHLDCLRKCKYLSHLHLTWSYDMKRDVYCSKEFLDVLRSFVYLECFLLIDSFVYQNDMLKNILNALPCNIKSITIEKNFGTTLPDVFGRFVKLESLILRGNCLHTLPLSLTNCKNLRIIDIRSYSRGLKYINEKFIGAFPKAVVSYGNMEIPMDRFIYGKYSIYEVQEACECGINNEETIFEEPQSLQSACIKAMKDDQYLTLPYDTNNRLPTSFTCYNCKKLSFIEGHKCIYLKDFIQIIGKPFDYYDKKQQLESVYFKFIYCKCCKSRVKQKKF
uniref:Leucine-rich repeat protein n=1 Tax=Parastrongyloides trichosuri TaxID=131310 RepID=A0A0N4ZYD8_PARTI